MRALTLCLVAAVCAALSLTATAWPHGDYCWWYLNGITTGRVHVSSFDTTTFKGSFNFVGEASSKDINCPNVDFQGKRKSGSNFDVDVPDIDDRSTCVGQNIHLLGNNPKITYNNKTDELKITASNNPIPVSRANCKKVKS